MLKGYAGFVVIALACGVGPVEANCSCQCIEGVARTLCTMLDEAQANPNACGSGPQKVACDPVAPSTDAPTRYDPPAGAVDCRAARLWDPRSAEYSVVAKICDLDRGTVVD